MAKNLLQHMFGGDEPKRVTSRGRDSHSSSTQEAENQSSTSAVDAGQAWERYLLAKAVYEETRELEHWQHMQKCITAYENALRS